MGKSTHMRAQCRKQTSVFLINSGVFYSSCRSFKHTFLSNNDLDPQENADIQLATRQHQDYLQKAFRLLDLGYVKKKKLSSHTVTTLPCQNEFPN